MSPDPWWLAYLGLGLFSGFMAGMLGLGGGAILVPLLAIAFSAAGFAREAVVHLALGTSMATIIFTSWASLKTHHAHGAVLWERGQGLLSRHRGGNPGRNRSRGLDPDPGAGGVLRPLHQLRRDPDGFRPETFGAPGSARNVGAGWSRRRNRLHLGAGGHRRRFNDGSLS